MHAYYYIYCSTVLWADSCAHIVVQKHRFLENFRAMISTHTHTHTLKAEVTYCGTRQVNLH